MPASMLPWVGIQGGIVATRPETKSVTKWMCLIHSCLIFNQYHYTTWNEESFWLSI